MNVGNLIKYRKLNENDSEWDRIKYFIGIVLTPDIKEPRMHWRIFWNTNLIINHLRPLYEPKHFEIIQ